MFSKKQEMIFIIGNFEDLQDFKKHFYGHDRKTLDGYFKIATNKNSVMVVRRISSKERFLQIIITPFKNIESPDALKKVLNRGIFHFHGQIRSIPIQPNEFFIFGNNIPKNTDGGFERAIIINKKINPFLNHKEVDDVA